MNFAGTLAETPLDCTDSDDSHLEDNYPRTSANEINLLSNIQREISKYMKGKGSFGQALFAHIQVLQV